MSSFNGIDSNKDSYKILNKVKSEYNSIKAGQSENSNNKYQTKGNQSDINNKNDNKATSNKKDLNLNLLIRKNAHAFEYFVLAILLGYIFLQFKFKGINAAVYILFACLLYAVIDEFHQSFVPGRTSLVSDVLIDFLGSILGLIVLLLVNYLKRRLSKGHFENE